VALDLQPTSDPQEALRAQLLAPMGGHKGYGLSLIVDVLAAVMTGSPVGSDADAHAHPKAGVGHFVLALRPDLFVSERAFHESLEQRLTEVLATPTADGSDGVKLPGDPELYTAELRRAEGIPLSDTLTQQLADLSKRVGSSPTPLMRL